MMFLLGNLDLIYIDKSVENHYQHVVMFVMYL